MRAFVGWWIVFAIVLAVLWTPASLCLTLPPLFMVLVVLGGGGF